MKQEKATGVTGTILDGVLSDEQQACWNARQLLAGSRIVTYLQTHGFGPPYPMLAAATGFGKGRVTAQLIERIPEILGKSQHDPTLLISGAKEMLSTQAVNAIAPHLSEGRGSALADLVEEDTGSRSFSILSGSNRSKICDDVNVAIWQGLAALQRRGRLTKFGLVIVDEGHNTGVDARINLLDSLEKDAIVGLTATAFRSSGKYRAPESYGFQIVDTISLPEGIQEGWNCPLLGIPIDPGYVLPADVREGENLNMQKLARELRKHTEYLPNVARLLAEVFLKGVDGKPGPKAIIPVNRVDEEAVVIAQILQDYGYSVGLAVNKQASKKWEHQFPTFGATDRHKLPADHPDAIQVLISPAVIAEGYDNPAVELIAWVVPTISALRYTQVLGRGTRICKGKAYCLVVDFPWFIEGFGYSTSLGQFFSKDELKELEDGRIWIGPKGKHVLLPQLPSLERFGKIVHMVNLQEVYPPAADWLNLNQLTRSLKRDREWVVSRLSTLDIKFELRKAPDGHILAYYPPVVMEELIKFNSFSSTGDWLTLPMIRQATGHSRGWIERNLEELGIAPELRRTKSGLVHRHYPPQVIEKLNALFGPTLFEIQSQVPHGKKLIKKRLEELCIQPISSPGNLTRYPADTIERLLSHSPPKAENWKTVKLLAQELRSSPKRLKCLAEELGIKPELRVAQNGKSLPHYSPEAFERLKERLNTQ